MAIYTDEDLDESPGGGGGGGTSSSGGVADWPSTAVRYYALDPDGGSDFAAGYSDTSMATAGTLAMRTWAVLEAIIPQNGDGRQIVIGIKPRAAGATIAEDFYWRGKTGYRSVIIHGTTDFSDTATDQKVAGAVVAASGAGAGGLYTAAAGATTSVVTVNGGDTLPAELSIVGKRVRFTGNVTGALANVVNNISSVTAGAGGTLTFGNNLGSAPAVDDTFYIEHPGVVFGKVYIAGEGASSGSPIEAIAPVTTGNGFSVWGIASTTTGATSDFTVCGPMRNLNMAFCESRGGASFASFLGVGFLNMQVSAIRNQAGSAVALGTGFLAEGAFFVQDCTNVTITPMAHTDTAGSAARFIRCAAFGLGGFGSYFNLGVNLERCGWGQTPVSTQGADGSNTTDIVFGRDPNGSTTRVTRIVGVPTTGTPVAGLYLRMSNCRVSGADITGVGARAGIRIEGHGVAVSVNAVSGSSSNTGAGIDVASCLGSTLRLGEASANTVTGTLGDILIGNSIITTHASLDTTNVNDERGNTIMGLGGTVAGQATVVTNKHGSALAIGDIVRSNATTGQVVKAQGDTAANAAGPLLTMVTPPANNADGYAVPFGHGEWVNCDTGPAAAALLYLDEGTAGVATSTVPPVAATNQKRRLGHALIVSGTKARVYGSPELLAVTSDGVAP